MGRELQFPRTPVCDRDYWLCRCEGFGVQSPERRVGTVEGLRFGTRVDRPDALAVRTGLFGRRVVLIPVSMVEAIAPEERSVRVARAPARSEPGPPRRLRTHLHRLHRETGGDPGNQRPALAGAADAHPSSALSRNAQED